MSPDQPVNGISLPMLSDDAAVEILNFLEVTLQRFESRYAHQIDRYYDSISQHNIAQCSLYENNDDPPF